MKIDKDKYEAIQALIDNLDETDEAIEEFIKNFKTITGVTKIMLAEDDVFEIEDLDFADIEDLQTYFTEQDIIDERHYKKLLTIAREVETREDFCAKATHYTTIPVRQYGTVVRMNNIDFSTRKDLIDYLMAFEKFMELADLSLGYVITEDGRGIELEGKAFVHDCKQSMIDNAQDDIGIEGYLSEGKVIWAKVDKNDFTEIRTKTGNLYMHTLLREANVKNIYFTKPDEIGIVEKPYPIAISQKNKYAFMFKTNYDV